MTITREEMVRKLSAKSGYNMKDIREVLRCMDDVVFEELCEVDDDNDVSIQLVQGIKVHKQQKYLLIEVLIYK